MLLEKISKTERPVEEGDDMSTRRPPLVIVWDGRPVFSNYPPRKIDRQERQEHRDDEASNSAGENATNTLPGPNRQAREVAEKVDVDLAHVYQFAR